MQSFFGFYLLSWLLTIVLIASASAAGAIIALYLSAGFVKFSCWLYNKVNGVAAPGLGRRDSQDFTLYRPPRWEQRQAPQVFRRYERATTRGVPVPRFAKALGLVLVADLGWGMVVGLALLVFLVAAWATSGTTESAFLLSGFFAIPVYLLLTAVVLKVFLPTRFGRGLLVAALHLMLFIAIFSMIGAAGLGAAALAGAPLGESLALP